MGRVSARARARRGVRVRPSIIHHAHTLTRARPDSSAAAQDTAGGIIRELNAMADALAADAAAD
jgi:hypothetical protein